MKTRRTVILSIIILHTNTIVKVTVHFANHTDQQWPKPRIRRCNYLPLNSLHALEASESLSCSQISFTSIWNGLPDKYTMQTHLGDISKHALYVCTIWDTRAFPLNNYYDFNALTRIVLMFVDITQTLVEIFRNMGIRCGFRAVVAGRKYSGFLLLYSNWLIYIHIILS